MEFLIRLRVLQRLHYLPMSHKKDTRRIMVNMFLNVFGLIAVHCGLVEGRWLNSNLHKFPEAVLATAGGLLMLQDCIRL